MPKPKPFNLADAQKRASDYVKTTGSTVDFKLGDKLDTSFPIILKALGDAFAAGYMAGRESV